MVNDVYMRVIMGGIAVFFMLLSTTLKQSHRFAYSVGIRNYAASDEF